MLPTNDRKNENNSPRCSHECLAPGTENQEHFLSKLSLDQALDLAFSYYDIGRLLDAEKICRLVLQKSPHEINAMQLLGTLLNQTGRYNEAIQLLREAIRQSPGHAELHNSLGIALYRLDEHEEAVSQFNRALQLRPDFAKAHNNLSAALMKLDRLDEAITVCRQAIHLQSDFKQAYNNLGLALKKKGELENAIASYKKAIHLDSEYAEAFCNLGMALIAQSRLKEAAENLQKAVSLVPDSAEFHNNLGILFNRQGLFEEAVGESEKAISLRPDYTQAYNNLGTALMELVRLGEANAAFKKAINIDPKCAEAHHNRSLVLLLRAQFEEGWKEYEWRWKHDGFSTPMRKFSQEWWNGSKDGVEKLLVWAEQGIGDEVQFSSLIPHITSKGIAVIIECDQRLVPLLKRSFPESIVVERSNPPATLLKDPSITHQIPMASIPRLLGLSPNSMPYQNPFMIPDEKQRDRFHSEYKAGGDSVLVGISFRSGNSQEGVKRSIGLEYWGPILKVREVLFVNLQYGECSKQLQMAHEQFGVEILRDDRINPLRDLESFAAQMAAMDLVISVDNSTVHFAGALGVEVWTMLPFVPDWRWGLEGDRTRWYPTMRLFRQQEMGNWEPVISKLAGELTSLVNQSKRR